MQDQDRVTHVVLHQVEDGFGHHHVRGRHPIIDGHDRPVGPIVHERVSVEGRNAFIVQGTQHLPNRQASGGTCVNRPIEMDEENLGLRACGGPVLVKVGRGDAHVILLMLDLTPRV